METVLSVAHYSPEPSSPYVLYVCQSVRFFGAGPAPIRTIYCDCSAVWWCGSDGGSGWCVRWRLAGPVAGAAIAACEAKFFVTCVGKKQFLCAAPQILAPWRPRAPDFWSDRKPPRRHGQGAVGTDDTSGSGLALDGYDGAAVSHLLPDDAAVSRMMPQSLRAGTRAPGPRARRLTARPWTPSEQVGAIYPRVI